jgi:hypothetical protein
LAKRRYRSLGKSARDEVVGDGRAAATYRTPDFEPTDRYWRSSSNATRSGERLLTARSGSSRRSASWQLVSSTPRRRHLQPGQQNRTSGPATSAPNWTARVCCRVFHVAGLGLRLLVRSDTGAEAGQPLPQRSTRRRRAHAPS